ncbi:SMI1/KNR4 family protein, partial [Chamaesiphon sp. GL140_3_metabinner_50]|uniref:SMI1/KNR4 family protein n=1 Tax=Chamaesiphon sp. GL140_3_metabinner_50 TaxID=2970812 RepID=UPI0025E43E53
NPFEIFMQENFQLLFDLIIEYGIKNKIIIPNDIHCASSNDILYIENKFNVSLPSTYKYFLAIYGNGNGQLIDNTFLEYLPNLLSLREDVQEMIEEDVATVYDPIPNDAFFFASTLSAHYWYFICNENIDPDVYYISVGDKKHHNCNKLSNFIIEIFNDSIDIIKRRERK